MPADPPGPGCEARELVDHLFRSGAGRMVAWLTRAFGPAHLELAEEVVQDALVKALQQWPYSGIPENPGGWLFRVARNGALDALRRDTTFRGRADAIAADIVQTAERAAAAPSGDLLKDDELRLMFLCCHPALARDARVALSLKTVGGFSVGEIARALVASETAVAQRLVRAKRQIRESGVTLDLPGGDELAARLESVLEVIYLLFNEGYSACAGDDLVRLDLCGEGLRLARLVADSPATTSPAAHALAALIAFQAARLPARVDDRGEVALLEDQDRSLWDARLLSLGFWHLDRGAEGDLMTPYHLQAGIAAAHAASTRDDVPWPAILAMYDDLAAIQPSPIVALNRAVALARIHGPRAGLDAIAAVEHEPALANYYLLGAVKGRLLFECGERAEAARWFRQALEKPCSEPERRLLRRRLEETQR